MSDPIIVTRVTIDAVDRLNGAVQERLRQMSKGRLREMIPRAIDGRFRLCVPPMDDDDDLILSALIDEVFALRERVAAVDKVVVAARTALDVFGANYGDDPDTEAAMSLLGQAHGALDAPVTGGGKEHQ